MTVQRQVTQDGARGLMGQTLSRAYDRHANGLDTLRLVLASGVILWHSFPLTGTEIELTSTNGPCSS